MSETIRLGIILAVSGGLMDAYSYILRDHVFANAQTGNILLLGINISQGEFQEALRYFFPVLCFALGIIMSEFVKNYSKRLHWRQYAVLLEACLLTSVALIPLKYNLLANSLISFACGIQVETFRKIHGNGIATTMCIGNLRSGTENLFHFLQTKSIDFIKKAGLYYGIIFSFVVGAVLGSACIKVFREKAILVSAGLMIAAFLMMFIDGENDHKGKNDMHESK